MNVWQKYLSVAQTAVTDYHRQARRELIDLFTAPRRRVIEIGSSAGYTGQYCKQKFPGVEYWGFDLNRAAAAESLAQLDKVICGKFEEQDLALLGLKPHSVDGVVLGDVLEHMYDPWRVLTALLPWLTEDAEVVVSLPNLRNLWLLNEIAEGRFTYDAMGLLDITHIRFFTLREMFGMMESTGYAIAHGSIVMDARLAGYHAQHAHIRGPHVFQYKSIAIKATGEDLSELCAVQFAFRATPRRVFRDLKPLAGGGGGYSTATGHGLRRRLSARPGALPRPFAGRARRAAHSGRSVCVLFAAVLPHAAKFRVVGRGLYGVDQRDARATCF